MAKRDLTFNSPIEINDTFIEDPFTSSSSENTMEELDVSEQDVRRNSVYGSTFRMDYEHSSLHDIEAGLLASEVLSTNYQDFDSSEGVINGADPFNIQQPTDYDRYPSMAGSKISSSSLPSNLFPASNNLNRFPKISQQEQDILSVSSKPNKPLRGSKDFSPFGGYPATLFPL
ncbi:uncharacterized protein AC631_05780, partial [Debaryomyces fabryi]